MKFLIQKFVHSRKVWYAAYYLDSKYHLDSNSEWEETFEIPKPSLVSSKNNFIEDWFLIEALLILIPFVFGVFVGRVY